MVEIRNNLSEKPYNVCITCPHIGKTCDGPNFFAMTTARLAEWCRMRKEHLHSEDKKWTNAYIADEAKVSKTTVDRFLAGLLEDLKVTTVQAILKVLVNGTWGQYPCAMAGENADGANLLEKVKTAEAECLRIQNELAAVQDSEKKKIDYLKEQVKFKEDQMLRKDKLLDERADYLRRKDRYIAALSVVAGLFFLYLMFIDLPNPNYGFLPFFRALFGI